MTSDDRKYHGGARSTPGSKFAGRSATKADEKRAMEKALANMQDARLPGGLASDQNPGGWWWTKQEVTE